MVIVGAVLITHEMVIVYMLVTYGYICNGSTRFIWVCLAGCFHLCIHTISLLHYLLIGL